MAKRAISLDIDGCIFNASFIERAALIQGPNPSYKACKNKNYEDAVSLNPLLWMGLTMEVHEYAEWTLFDGSHRQSEYLDYINVVRSNKNGERFLVGSCFPVFPLITNYLRQTYQLSVRWDNLLLDDIYEARSDGSSYQKALDKLQNERGDDPARPEMPIDESKVSLLYAQMHKFAADNPGEQLVFDFYDDREDILNWLSGFYSAFPSKIPAKLTLRLYHYEGKQMPKMKAEINSRSLSDRDDTFRETVISLRDEAMKAKCMGSIRGTVNVANLMSVTTEDLTPRTVRRSPLHFFLTDDKEKMIANANLIPSSLTATKC